MFWNRRAKNELKAKPTLQALATQLGVERRFAVRVNYPSQIRISKLPQIYFDGKAMTVRNISIGGCLLLDPQEILGPSLGHEFELELHWSTAVERVTARIVSRVDCRRHIQFLNLSKNRQVQLLKSVVFGIRGLSMTRHALSSELGPTMQAAELWSSPLNDSVVLENDIHRVGQIHLNSEQYVLFREAWPNKVNSGKCTKPEFEQLVLFLANIPLPSAHLSGMIKYLESLFLEGGSGL